MKRISQLLFKRLVFLSPLCLLTVSAVSAVASPPSSNTVNAVPLLMDGTLDALAGTLRGFLVQNLPRPLVETSSNWGHTQRVANGITWKGQGFKVHPVVQHKDKNDGVWRRLKLTAENLPNTLVFDLRNLQQPDKGPATFDAFISFDANVEHETQRWESGIRLYSGSMRARFRVKLALKCEATSRLDKGDNLVPDVLFRLRVLHADLNYDNFVMEHVAGMGGEAAKIIGDAAKSGVRRFHPSLERDMLAKANAAIVKAADTKEVRIGLGKLMK